MKWGIIGGLFLMTVLGTSSAFAERRCLEIDVDKLCVATLDGLRGLQIKVPFEEETAPNTRDSDDPWPQYSKRGIQFATPTAGLLGAAYGLAWRCGTECSAQNSASGALSWRDIPYFDESGQMYLAVDSSVFSKFTAVADAADELIQNGKWEVFGRKVSWNGQDTQIGFREVSDRTRLIGGLFWVTVDRTIESEPRIGTQFTADGVRSLISPLSFRDFVMKTLSARNANLAVMTIELLVSKSQVFQHNLAPLTQTRNNISPVD